MTREALLDFRAVDGRVARAARAVDEARGLLEAKEGREEARARDPFDGLRDVAGRSTFDALRELDVGPALALHRDALVRWVHELLQARVGWGLTVDEADALVRPDPSLASRAARERAIVSTPSGPLPSSALDLGAALVTFDAARRALVTAQEPAAIEIAFRRLGELAEPVAAVRGELRARRFEAARRLGLDHPWALATSSEGGAASLERLARDVLDATEPLASALHEEQARRAGVRAPWRTIVASFARDAREGWPSRLTTRWLEDVFRAIAPRPPRVSAPLPLALGGASFLRAAAAWGAALRLEGAARALPFALAQDPYPAEAYALGGALALAVADRVFAKRKLRVSSRLTDVHARALGLALLFTLRAYAAQLLAATVDPPRDAELEELTARVFGAPTPRALARAWSFGGFSGAARVDAPARLVGAVKSHALVRGLVERFDEDWFDNPRAGAHLASAYAGPVWQGDVPPAEAVRAIARAFEELLG